MKNTLLVGIFLLLAGISGAQALPEIGIIQKTKWENTQLGKGLRWQHFHFKNKELFASNQNIHILRFKNNSRKWQISLISGGDELYLTSEMAIHQRAIAAVNGSFFDMKNGGAVDYIRIEGQILDTNRLTGGKLSFHQKSAIAIVDNKLEILRQEDSLDTKWAEKQNYKNMMVTGPLLLWKGTDAPLSKIAFNDNRHPRTCACVTAKGEVLLLTADGRSAEAQGLSLTELTIILKALGCRDAVNFDGGGSTTMYVAGQAFNGVVNMPCDNKKFDHEGERKVSNILLIKPISAR